MLPQPVFAAPDPTKCNFNTTYTVLSTTSSPKTCDDPDCEYGRSNAWLGSIMGEVNIYCRRAGPTTSEPSYKCNDPDYPYILYNRGPFTDGSTKCCTDSIARNTCIDATPYCGSTSKLNGDKSACEQFKATAWSLNLTFCNGTEGVDTAIGCVPTGNLQLTVGFVLKFALGASAGIIVLMLIATGYNLLTSQGNPEKLAAAKENVVSIFSGLILIIFSLVLLQTVGSSVLGLPTF